MNLDELKGRVRKLESVGWLTCKCGLYLRKGELRAPYKSLRAVFAVFAANPSRIECMTRLLRILTSLQYELSCHQESQSDNAYYMTDVCTVPGLARSREHEYH